MKFIKNGSIENLPAIRKNIYVKNGKEKNAGRIFLLLALAISFVTHAQTGSVFATLKGTPVNTTGWSLQGAATVTNVTGTGNSEVMLCPKVGGSSGSVFYKTPVDLALCDNQWTVEFDFRIFDGNKADGIAFCFLDAVPTGFAVGGGLGIPAAANGLKVCFDTYDNCGTGGVPKIEIRSGTGYSECWNQPTVDNSTGSLSFIRSTTYNHAKIIYSHGNISAYVNGGLYLTGFQLITFTGYFGFTAGTGGNVDNHSIKNVVIYPSVNTPPLTDLSVCSGTQIQIGTTAMANYTYSWAPSTGLSSNTISNPRATLSNPSNSTITQKYYLTTAFNNLPACAVVDSVVVSVLPNQPLIINFAGSTSSSVTFNWNAINGATAYDYSYTIDAGTPFTGTTNTATSKAISGLNPGDEVNITVTSVGGTCSTASSQTGAAMTLTPPCAPIATSPSAVNITNGTTKTYTVTADNSTAGIAIDILTLDNSFNLTINGVQLNTVGDFQYDASVSGNHIVFSNGTGYGQSGLTSVWNITGTISSPLIRVLINPDGTVQLYGSKTSGGPLFPMHATNSLNTFPWNTSGNNTIVLGQQVVGPTHMTATEYGLVPVSSAGIDINNVCAGSSSVLTGSPNTGVWTIQPAPPNPTASVLGTTSAGEATVDFPINAAGIYHYIYTVGGACADTVNVTVIAKPDAGADQTICAGTSATLTGISPGAGVWAAAAANPAGATIGTTAGGIATADFSPTAAGTYNFIYTAGGCSDTMSVKVNANVIPAFAQPPSICSGEILTALPITSINGITGTWSPALNNTATTLYTFIPATGQCATTATMMITVNPLPVYTDLTINCTGGILNSVIVNATVSEGIMEYNVDAGPYQTSSTFNGLSAGLHMFNIRVQGAMCSISTGLQNINCTCSVITNNIISADQNICSGSVPSSITGTAPVSTPTVAFTYQWQASNDGVAWNDIKGATSKDFTPGAVAQAVHYRRLVKITGCADAGSNVIIITVNPNQTLTVTCGIITLSGVQFNWNAIAGATSYNYSYAINSGPVVTGSTVNTTLVVNSLNGNDAVAITVVPVGANCTVAGMGNCTAAVCSVITNNIIGFDQSICSGMVPSPITGTPAVATPAVEFNYQWQSGADGINWTDIAGAIQKDFTPAVALTQSTYYRRLVQAAGCPDAISNMQTVMVSPNQALIVNCGIVTLSSIQFSWNAIAGAISYGYSYTINNGTAITGTTSSTALDINNLNATDAVAITVIPIGSSCTAAGTGNCTAASCPVVANNSIGSGQSICSGTTPLILNGSMPNISPSTAFTYQWQSSADGIGWTDIAGALSEDFTPGILTKTMHYQRLVKIAGCNNDISKMATITVNQSILPSFAIPTTYCQNSIPKPLPVTSDNGIAGTWNPATISTITAGIDMYKFTPAAGLCVIAPPVTIITITSNSKAVFTFATSYCQNTVPVSLPTMSGNGISGIWSPAAVTTATTGTGVYVFTPAAAQCNTEIVRLPITVNAPPPAFSLGKDTTFCDGETLLLKPNNNIAGNYVWQDGSTGTGYLVKKSGVYHLSVSNDCGLAEDTINVTVGAGACKLLLPNAFTPNGNGSDDVFKVKYPFPVKQFTMIIYNRWGQKIFESNNILKGWDGKLNGIIQSQDTFVWMINLTDMEGVKQSAKGTVILFR